MVTLDDKCPLIYNPVGPINDATNANFDATKEIITWFPAESFSISETDGDYSFVVNVPKNGPEGVNHDLWTGNTFYFKRALENQDGVQSWHFFSITINHNCTVDGLERNSQPPDFAGTEHFWQDAAAHPTLDYTVTEWSYNCLTPDVTLDLGQYIDPWTASECSITSYKFFNVDDLTQKVGTWLPDLFTADETAGTLTINLSTNEFGGFNPITYNVRMNATQSAGVTGIVDFSFHITKDCTGASFLTSTT